VCFSHGAPLHAATQHKPTVNQVTDDMLIKISDFGLSRTKKGTTVINSIHIAGSPGWMAPEVRGGIDIGNSGGDREE
jgi:serine/threonine protein kinase